MVVGRIAAARADMLVEATYGAIAAPIDAGAREMPAESVK